MATTANPADVVTKGLRVPSAVHPAGEGTIKGRRATGRVESVQLVQPLLQQDNIDA